MKKIILCLLCFLLAGCTEKYPDESIDGSTWNRDWTILGSTLGIEDPGYDLELLENPVVLTADDTYYATFVAGESSTYLNEDNEECDLYPLQLYVLLYGCSDNELAIEAKSDWEEREVNTYGNVESDTAVVNQVEYDVLHYDIDSSTNPYSQGVSAFGVYSNYTIVVELLSTDEYDGNVDDMIDSILAICHIAKD